MSDDDLSSMVLRHYQLPHLRSLLFASLNRRKQMRQYVRTEHGLLQGHAENYALRISSV